MNTQLMAEAKKIQTKDGSQKKAYKNLKAIETAKENKEIAKLKLEQEILDRRLELFEKLKQFDGLNLKYVYMKYKGAENRTALIANSKLNLVMNRESIGSFTFGPGAQCSFSNFWTFTISSKTIHFAPYRLAYTFSQAGKYLAKGVGKNWSTHDLDLPDLRREFESIDEVVEHIKGVILETLDLDAEKEQANQTVKKNLLKEYLGQAPSDTDLENHTILEKSEVKPYFCEIVKNDLTRYFDLGLMAEFSDLDYDQLQSLRSAIKDSDTLNLILPKLVDVDAYAGKLAEQYAFDKFVVAFKKHYIVEGGK